MTLEKLKKNAAEPKNWGKGLLAALIGGAATAVMTAFSAPGHFDPSSAAGLVALGKIALAGGIVAVAGYLKQSPLPK
jgi:hypothetical protein